MGLADYKDVVGTTASVCTMAQMFSGMLVCRDIYKQGTAEGKDPIPFVGGIGMGMLMLVYALLMKDTAMISVNVFGLTISIFYVIFFFLYTPNKRELVKTFATVMAITIGFLTYAWLEDPDKLEFRWGLLITVVLFLLIGAPLFNLKEIIRTKNTDILPFPMILMGTIVASQWLLYGIILENHFMIFQNVVGLALQIVQLSLFVIYPSNADKKLQESKKKE
ncbi:hypothetical protein HCN44_003823 [Aphidius gifuensis]|uniref:Sugar transporter SWEET n=1 Tax=Aphidius gifuensis TaxID=684658 RepID=A0A834Y0M5_APHGI|nr:sugar transporter SWEET1-like [Aphidius gifuensis]KAF7994351.1 hypothetical protein HCN44_003823 [Aphidius gifuensis]